MASKAWQPAAKTSRSTARRQNERLVFFPQPSSSLLAVDPFASLLERASAPRMGCCTDVASRRAAACCCLATIRVGHDRRAWPRTTANQAYSDAQPTDFHRRCSLSGELILLDQGLPQGAPDRSLERPCDFEFCKQGCTDNQIAAADPRHAAVVVPRRQLRRQPSSIRYLLPSLKGSADMETASGSRSSSFSATTFCELRATVPVECALRPHVISANEQKRQRWYLLDLSKATQPSTP